MSQGLLKWCLLISFLLISGYILYCLWWNQITQINPSLAIKRDMSREFRGKSFGQIVPVELYPGQIYWFDEKELHIVRQSDVYAVNVMSASNVFQLNGIPMPEVLGIIAAFGKDRKASYCNKTNSIIEYDPTNGMLSSGDIVYSFRR